MRLRGFCWDKLSNFGSIYLSIAEIKSSEGSAEQPPVEPATDSIVAAVPAEPLQEPQKDLQDLPQESVGNGNGRALVPLEDQSLKKNGVEPPPENNNSPTNVAEAEGQQKVRHTSTPCQWTPSC